MIEFGRPHRHLVECVSTNDQAREWIAGSTDPAPSGALVTADYQTGGRGQRGRSWEAAAGQSALMSFVYHLLPGANAGQLGLVTALAAAEALDSLGVSPQIKWPNDLLIDGRKVGGILVEVAAGAAVLGIGINVGQESFPGGSAFACPPTSLRLASGQEVSVSDVIEAAARELTETVKRWQDGSAAIVPRCRLRLATGAALHRGELSARLFGLTDTGAAVVRLPDGTFAEWTTVS